ncbi:MAG TPA: hypothetical protein H9853_01665 [Candidatus Sphingobacterium stercoripullorum]|uniref:Uncharacterized protein n=1 Tax=Candidatus Sphingobacterium stercoripullorum TaxID=2838759 RepID=A0A9D1W6Q5_9SPHI|nr:hypothetical protein [Candidatus Sphingobacterium stercoripullorum]
MEQMTRTRGPRTIDNNANKSSHYVTLTLAIIIGVAGTFLRFLPDVVSSLYEQQFTFSLVANILLVIGAILGFKVVFAIMKDEHN